MTYFCIAKFVPFVSKKGEWERGAKTEYEVLVRCGESAYSVGRGFLSCAVMLQWYVLVQLW